MDPYLFSHKFGILFKSKKAASYSTNTNSVFNVPTHILNKPDLNTEPQK